MEEGFFSIKVSGELNGVELSLANADIAIYQMLLEQLPDLLYPELDTNTRPSIVPEFKDGSLMVQAKADSNYIEVANTRIINLINNPNQDLIGIPKRFSDAVLNFQSKSKKMGFEFKLSTSFSSGKELIISKANNWIVSKDVLVTEQHILRGMIVDAGGQSKANIHLKTDGGIMVISASKEQLKSVKGNLLYSENYKVNVSVKRNITTNELVPESYVLIDIIEIGTSSDFDLNDYIKKGTEAWKGVNVDEFLDTVRYE